MLSFHNLAHGILLRLCIGLVMFYVDAISLAKDEMKLLHYRNLGKAIHRLDRLVSGLLILARNSRTADFFRQEVSHIFQYFPTAFSISLRSHGWFSIQEVVFLSPTGSLFLPCLFSCHLRVFEICRLKLESFRSNMWLR